MKQETKAELRERIAELEKQLENMTNWKNSAEMRVKLANFHHNELARVFAEARKRQAKSALSHRSEGFNEGYAKARRVKLALYAALATIAGLLLWGVL